MYEHSIKKSIELPLGFGMDAYSFAEDSPEALHFYEMIQNLVGDDTTRWDNIKGMIHSVLPPIISNPIKTKLS